jgi:hypothetical protein
MDMRVDYSKPVEEEHKGLKGTERKMEEHGTVLYRLVMAGPDPVVPVFGGKTMDGERGERYLAVRLPLKIKFWMPVTRQGDKCPGNGTGGGD